MRSGIAKEAKSVVAAAAAATAAQVTTTLLSGAAPGHVENFQTQLCRIVLGGRHFGNMLEVVLLLQLHRRRRIGIRGQW